MFARALPIADAVLFEGYLLYPYRTSSPKNERRWTFGTLLPGGADAPALGEERSFFHVELLVLGDDPALRVLVRFLEELADASDAPVRDVAIPAIRLREIAAGPAITPFREGGVQGTVTLASERVGERCWRATVRVENATRCTTELRERALARLRPGIELSMGSAHALIGCEDGELVSAIDPPAELAELAAKCRCVGTWPVLVGDRVRRDVVLASPIVLEEFPAIAEQSVGDLFDATEMDQMLTLRILTMTHEERLEARATDPRAAALIERVESLGPEQLARLHGVWRDRAPTTFHVGERVRLAPSARGDAMDVLLRGRTATVAAVQRDLDDRVHVVVTIDDDPGRDLGVEGRKPGHRFYFRSDEVERLDAAVRS